MLYTWHSICDVLCELRGYIAMAVLDLGSDGIGILHHCLVLRVHVLIILELLGHFNDRDGTKLGFSSSFSLFCPFLSLSFWIPLVNWICRRGTSQFNVSDECRQLSSNTRTSLHAAIVKCQDLDQKNAFSWLTLMFSFKIWHVKLQLLFLKFSKAKGNT